MQYKLIRDDKTTTEEKEGLFSTLTVLIPIVLVIYFLKDVLPLYIILSLFLLIFYFLPRLLRTFNQDWVHKKDIIGFVEFDADRISISNDLKEIDVNKIVRMKLNFNYIKGKKYNLRDIIHNGLAVFLIDLNDGGQQRIVFLIETKEQHENLSLIMKGYYQKRIEIKEFLCRFNVKTILLKPSLNWSYTALKDLKQESNID